MQEVITVDLHRAIHIYLSAFFTVAYWIRSSLGTALKMCTANSGLRPDEVDC